MAVANTQDDRIQVAAVCGNEVRVYDEIPDSGRARPLVRTIQFQHYGAAKLFADEFEEAERLALQRRR